MSVPGLREYVLRYGRRGWLCGLRDRREVTGSIDTIKSLASSDERSAIVVSDLFLWHYLQAKDDLDRWPVHWDRSELDRLAREAIKQLIHNRTGT